MDVGAQTPWQGSPVCASPPFAPGRGEAPGGVVRAPADLASELGWAGAGPGSGSDTAPRQASPRRALERHFHAVVAAVEQTASEPSATREGHLERLEEIYCSLLGPTAAARGRCGGKRRALSWGTTC